MQAEERHIETPRTARYYVLGKAGPQVKEIWVVLHGYGQLAAYFIQKFGILSMEDRLVIAPEALSRYYVSNSQGRVGASWMTKDDRINEIKDYISYLDTLFAQLKEEAGATSIKLIVLGFSQGVATASRWASMGKIRADHLILWAGDMPRDIPFERFQDEASAPKLWYLHGTEDTVVSAETIQASLKMLEEKGIRAEYLSFEGGHALDEDTLLELEKRIGI